MKTFLIFTALFLNAAWAKPLVLLSYYDAYDGQALNNSQSVAQALKESFGRPGSPVSVSLCPLRTVFDVAYGQLENCMKQLPQRPSLVISLGESTCDLKLEFVLRNRDKTVGPDNAGNHRNNSKIIPEAPEYLGQRFPLAQMYCALDKRERGKLDLSNNAGSFVCNNTAFQMSWFYPEVQFGFIHVPAAKCRNRERRTEEAVTNLEKMIMAGVRYAERGKRTSEQDNGSVERRLPVTKAELDELTSRYAESDPCLHEFFKRAKGVDERRGIWPF